MLHTINGFYVFFYFLFGTLMLHYLNFFFFILAHLILLFKVFSFCFEPKTIFHYIISEGLPTPMNIYILFPIHKNDYIFSVLSTPSSFWSSSRSLRSCSSSMGTCWWCPSCRWRCCISAALSCCSSRCCFLAWLLALP